MPTDELTIEIDGEEVEVYVEYEISGKYIPGNISGPPEKCYPAEYPEIDIISVRNEDDEEILDTKVWPTRADRELWEEQMLARADDDGFDPDRAYEEWADK